MYKQCLILWRKPGLSREGFKDYYDRTHLDCVSSQLPSPPRSHRRHYPVWDDALTVVSEGFERFDAFATVSFDDASRREEWRKTLMASQLAREAIEKDEANFIDMSKRMMCVVDEATTASSPSGAANGVKAYILRFLKYRGAATSRDNVKELHEKAVAAQAQQLPADLVHFKRNYLLPEHPWSYSRMPEGVATPSSWIDVIEELGFPDRGTAAAAMPRINRLFGLSPLATARDVSSVYVEVSSSLPERWRAH
jgi:hypothetical protein